MTCTSCGPTPAQPSPTVRDLCVACWRKLPTVTRTLYERGALKVRRVGLRS